MYNVGFGDAFLFAFDAGGRTARILFDCGSIAMPDGRTISQVASRVLEDARDADGVARIDVVVATHRHKDHVSGFAQGAWAAVEVKEVWMPWTEDPADPAAREIRDVQSKLALALGARLAAAPDPVAELLLDNALSNETAMRTLHAGFKGVRTRRFLPSADGSDRTFTTDALPGVTVHVLGPSRDKEVIRDMTPPAGEAYLRLNAAPLDPASGERRAPFPARFERGSPPAGQELADAERKKLRDATRFDDLDAAVALDAAVNGTSLMIVLDVGGTRFLFPGDAQWGTWNAAMKDPASADLLRRVRFYKVGHHGSENATPRQFVEKLLSDRPWAMVSTIERSQWKNVPKPALLDALRQQKHAILVRSDEDEAAPAVPKVFEIEHGVVVEARVPLG
jgi:beta-lactamase superfamily II metal-dependent hydrolase